MRILISLVFVISLNTLGQSLRSNFNTLVWSDEFNENGTVDSNKWFHQTKLIAGDSWANNEQQHYTNRIENSFVSNGTLKIKAIRESFTDQGVEKQYTSARLNAKFAFKYGRVEVRAKLPSVAGTWPAIWLLGKNINEDGTYWDNVGFGTQNWPWCGEIDIMEPNIAKTEILGTWHWNNGVGYRYFSKSIATQNTDTSQNFHIYSLEWTPDSMKIYMDNILINEMSTFVPFNREYFILLNLAMGGNLGGTISSSFSSDLMEIDYVRVYQDTALSVNSIDFETGTSIHPNPTLDIIKVELGNQYSVKSISIFDITGKKLLKTSRTIISLKDFNPGIYLLKITNNLGDVVIKKVIKK